MSWRVLLVCISGSAPSSASCLYTHLCAQTSAWTVSLLSCPWLAPVSSCSFQPRALAACEAALWPPVPELLTHPPSKASHFPSIQPHHGQLQQELNGWSALPAGSRACSPPSCSPQRREMSAVVKSKRCDLHEPTQLSLHGFGVSPAHELARAGEQPCWETAATVPG